jgi:hypothetical protein
MFTLRWSQSEIFVIDDCNCIAVTTLLPQSNDDLGEDVASVNDDVSQFTSASTQQLQIFENNRNCAHEITVFGGPGDDS